LRRFRDAGAQWLGYTLLACRPDGGCIPDERGLEEIPSYVEDTGEVNWLVNDALHMEVPIPVISQAVMQLIASRDSDKYWARAVAMIRHGFGGHPYGPSEPVAKERREGRVGGFVPLQEERK